MKLGGPIFRKGLSFEEEATYHQKLGFGAAYCTYIEDPQKRRDYQQAYAGANILLAEYGAYRLNILDTDPALRQKNVDEICRRLEYADEMGVLCCVIHGGSVETGKWGSANPLNVSEKSIAATVAIIQGILDRVKPGKTRLVMETESYVLPDSPEIYARLIEAVDRSSFGVHLDPVNIISSPRRYYHNAQFIKRCFAVLGPWIVSCHAKDTFMPPMHTSVQIDETFIGNGFLDYGTYIQEINKLGDPPPLMIEHLNESQLVSGLKYIFKIAEEVGIIFEGSEHREALAAPEDTGEWFAPHL